MKIKSSVSCPTNKPFGYCSPLQLMINSQKPFSFSTTHTLQFSEGSFLPDTEDWEQLKLSFTGRLDWDKAWADSSQKTTHEGTAVLNHLPFYLLAASRHLHADMNTYFYFCSTSKQFTLKHSSLFCTYINLNWPRHWKSAQLSDIQLDRAWSMTWE